MLGNDSLKNNIYTLVPAGICLQYMIQLYDNYYNLKVIDYFWLSMTMRLYVCVCIYKY